ncbi:MAG: hypothetical protein J6S80_02380 [Alphaproteobacteria bacterium]|nr:hypothetical protein [Alphaproteobacteria bacterium]
MKDNKKLNTALGYAAWFGDYAIAATTGVLVAGRKVREDIMDIENITTWVPVFKTYKKHYIEHVRKHNNDKLSVRAFSRYLASTKKYNPFAEIDKKNIGDIVKKMEHSDYMTVQYFEKTEHQRAMPQLCKFGDYIVQFASDGTEWCGGMRGNGYISMVDHVSKQIRPVAPISPQLSDYLANIVMQKAK